MHSRLSPASKRLSHLTQHLSRPSRLGPVVQQPPHAAALTMTSKKTQEPVITAVEDLPTAEAKWVTLKRIHYTDQTGKQRTWESAERKTRTETSGVDAVYVFLFVCRAANFFCF